MEQLLPQLWEMAKVAGPFGTAVMILVWLREARRVDRMEAERTDLMERTITATNNLTNAVQAINSLLINKGRR